MRNKFQQAWMAVGGKRDADAVYGKIEEMHTSPGRVYHTIKHASDCILELWPIRDKAEHPYEVAMALWFHNAVYNAREKGGKEKSARFAEDVLTNAGVSEPSVRRVCEDIIATKQHIGPASKDAALTADIDITIFGKSQEEFLEYDNALRRENLHIKDDEFWKERKEEVDRFLKREHIYRTEHFRAKYERKALLNLMSASMRL